MARRKMTVILLPDEDQYQVVFPHYPNCITYGSTVEEALANAKEAIELELEAEADETDMPFPPNVHSPHVVVGEIEAEVPDNLLERSWLGGLGQLLPSETSPQSTKALRARVQQGKGHYQGYLELVGQHGLIKIPVGPWRDKKGDAYADARIAEHRHRQQTQTLPAILPVEQ